MKQCDFCKENFTNEDAYQIHLGIGAPAFHDCLDEAAMKAKGMTVKAGVWAIAASLITHHQGWARLKSDWAPGHLPPETPTNQPRIPEMSMEEIMDKEHEIYEEDNRKEDRDYPDEQG